MGLTSFLRTQKSTAPPLSGKSFKGPTDEYDSDSPPYSPTASEMERPTLPSTTHRDLRHACAVLVELTNPPDPDDEPDPQELSRKAEVARKAKLLAQLRQQRNGLTTAWPAVPRSDPEASIFHVEKAPHQAFLSPAVNSSQYDVDELVRPKTATGILFPPDLSCNGQRIPARSSSAGPGAVLARGRRPSNGGSSSSVQEEIQELARKRADEYTARHGGAGGLNKQSKLSRMTSSSDVAAQQHSGISRAGSFASSIAQYIRPRTSRDLLASRQRSASTRSIGSTDLTSPGGSRPDSRASNQSNVSNASSWWRGRGLRKRGSWTSFRSGQSTDDASSTDRGGRFRAWRRGKRSDSPDLNRPLPALPGLDQYRETKTHIGQLISKKGRRENAKNQVNVTPGKVKKNKISTPQPLLPVDTPYTATLPLDVQERSMSALGDEILSAPNVQSAPLLGGSGMRPPRQFFPESSASSVDATNTTFQGLNRSFDAREQLNNPVRDFASLRPAPELPPIQSLPDTKKPHAQNSSRFDRETVAPSLAAFPIPPSTMTDIPIFAPPEKTLYQQIQAREMQAQSQTRIEEAQRQQEFVQRQNQYKHRLQPVLQNPVRSRSPLRSQTLQSKQPPPAFSLQDFRPPRFNHSATFPLMSPQMLSPRTIPKTTTNGYGFPDNSFAPPSAYSDYDPPAPSCIPSPEPSYTSYSATSAPRCDQYTSAGVPFASANVPSTGTSGVPLMYTTTRDPSTYSSGGPSVYSTTADPFVTADKEVKSKTTSKTFQFPGRRASSKSRKEKLGHAEKTMMENHHRAMARSNSRMNAVVKSDEPLPVNRKLMMSPPPPPMVRGPSFNEEIQAGMHLHDLTQVNGVPPLQSVCSALHPMAPQQSLAGINGHRRTPSNLRQYA